MTEQEGITVEFNLFDLKLRLQRAKGEEISWAEIGRRAGVHPNTLTSLYQNKARRVDLATVEKLLAYFRSEGLEIGPGDLFVMTEGEKEAA